MRNTILFLILLLTLSTVAQARGDRNYYHYYRHGGHGRDYYGSYAWPAFGVGVLLGAVAAQEQQRPPAVVYIQKPQYLPVYDKNGNVIGYVQQ